MAGESPSLPALAARLGVTDRHLRRIFQAAHGVAPLDYLSHAAPAAGQAAAHRHHAAGDPGGAGQRLRQPAPLQRRLRRTLPAQPDASCGAGPPSPTRRRRPRCGCAWPTGRPTTSTRCSASLQRRVLDGVEQVAGRAHARTLRLRHGGSALIGWIGVHFDARRHELVVDAAPALAPALGRWLQRLRGAFDLDADPAPIDAVLPRCRCRRCRACGCPGRSTASRPRCA